MARSRDKAVLAYVHPVDIAAGFHHSLLALVLHDMTGPRRLADILTENSSANITNARNRIVARFLATTADWLWMIDADMVFGADTLDRLLDSAHHVSAPVVGGLCFGVHDHRLFPTLYDLREEDGVPHMVRWERFDTGAGKVRVSATGAACLLVHRGVLEAVYDKAPSKAYPWFQETWLGDQPMGEDVTFCLRVGAAGFPVHVDLGIQIGHQKAYVADTRMYSAQCRIDDLDAGEARDGGGDADRGEGAPEHLDVEHGG